MDTCNQKMRVGGLLAIAAVAVVGTFMQNTAQAAAVYIDSVKAIAPGSTGIADNSNFTAFGPGATSTVNNIWKTSDGSVSISPLDDYYAQVNDNTGAGYSMRSPAGGTTAATFTFAGASLHLTKTGSNLRLKMPNESTLSANLVMETGSVISNDNTGFHYTLDGTLRVIGTPQIYPPGSGKLLTIHSALIGAGTLGLVSNGTPPNIGDFEISGASGSDFTGVVNYARNVTVSGNGAFGSGTLHQSTSTMILTITANDAFNDGAKLELLGNAANASVVLNNTVADTLTSIMIGTTTYSVANGNAGETFGAIGSLATHESAIFSGSGMLQVVPEPASLGLLAVSFLAMLRRRRHEV